MAGRKLLRDFLISRQRLFLHRSSLHQASRLRLISAKGYSGNRGFSAFNEFSRKVKGEANKNSDFQQSFKELKEKAEELKGVKEELKVRYQTCPKELKEKAEELKGVKEELKVRTKQKTEKLYKHVDGVWMEAEATAKKVSANVKEKISAATEEVKESLGIGKQESTNGKAKNDADVKDGEKVSNGEQKSQQSSSKDTAETFFGKFKSTISSSKGSTAFQRFKEAKFVDLAKKGYDIVNDELHGSPKKRKHLQREPSSTPQAERSTRTEVVVLPSQRSPLGEKWEALKSKVRGHPVFKRLGVVTDPVVTKSQEIAEDVRERWETSDNPIVHKIQDFNETIFQETDAAATIKEIRSRDLTFSLPEFVAEVQEVIKPVLNAYIKGDVETLKKFCTNEVIERCKAELSAYRSHDIFFDNKILHVSEVEVRETKMMGSSPIIIVAFQTQQVYCVRDKTGKITEGGKDTIHTVYYAWAMQQVDPEELSEGALYPIWKLREMQQLGVQSLI